MFEATILESPQEKTNSFQSVAKITSFISNETFIPANEQVIAYFSKTSEAKNLTPGSIILFNSNPQQIKNFGNPYEFDYKKYLERKKIYRQVYLDENSWLATKYQQKSIIVIAEKTRQKLLNIYQKLPIDEKEFEILSALTLGYKRDLDPETKRVFSSAGAMHVLAVSGLHVGIIFWIIIIMFGYLRKQKSGRIIFTIISILTLWGYAFITGLSPSVMRAASMFSILILGETLQRKPNIYNSLAASAFILLLINPNNLFESGFQLSYSAVFGIVFLQPKLSSLLSIEHKIPKFFWDLLCVSIAAQIATVPFILYYFGQFPMYFWLTNMIIIPAVMVLIPFGMFLLFISFIPIIANFSAVVVNSIIKSIYFLLSHIELLPYSVLNVAITRSQQIFLIVIILTFFLILKSKKIIYLHFAFLAITIFIGLTIFQNIKYQNKNELIVYNNPDNATLQLIRGKINFIVSENEINADDQVKKAIGNTILKRKLFQPQYFTFNDTIVSNDIYIGNGIIYFEGKTILVGNHEINGKIINPDMILNPSFSVNVNFNDGNRDIILTNRIYNNSVTNNETAAHYKAFETAYRKIW